MWISVMWKASRFSLTSTLPHILARRSLSIGRMKGKIKPGAKAYKMSSKSLTQEALATFENNNNLIKVPLNCEIKIIKNSPISMHISSACDIEIYRKLDIYCEIDAFPQDAINQPLEKEKILNQITKTNNTPYFFKNIKIKLDENTFLPNIKALNELRRTALNLVEDFAKNKIIRTYTQSTLPQIDFAQNQTKPNISILLNNIDHTQDYSKLERNR